MIELRRAAALACFYVIGVRLPSSTTPVVGKLSRAIRGWLGRLVLDGVGTDTNIEQGAYIGRGHGITLGDRSGIGVNCRLHGPVAIGRDVMMGPEVVVLSRNHRWQDAEIPMIDQGFDEADQVTIGDDVWIGTRVIVLPGVSVGKGSIVGAGSVVTRDVDPYTVVAGNPARPIGQRGALRH